jgi:AcrR family transcriptional regulator
VLLFRHFGSKKGLFEAAIVEPFSQLFDGWVDHIDERATEASDSELVAEYVASMYGLILENRDLVLAMVAALAHEPEIHQGDSADSLSEAFRHIEGFTAGQVTRRGLNGLDLPVTVRVGAAMIIGMALLDPWLFGSTGRRPAQRRIIDEMATFMSFGVAGRLGGAPQTPG